MRSLTQAAFVAALSFAFVGCGGGGGGGSSSNAALSLTAQPSSGPYAGGNQVRLVVTGLHFDGGNATASFGGVPARVVSVKNRELLVVVPPAAAAGPVEVVVTSQGRGSPQLSGQVYSYDANPTPPASTGPVGSTATGGVTSGSVTPPPPPPPATGGNGFQFRPGTDKWYIVTDDPTLCDADQDGRFDLDQVLDVARGPTGGSGAFAGKRPDATRLVMSYTAQLYGNRVDGTVAPSGIKITFQSTKPTAGATPAPGTSERCRNGDHYNTMAWQHLGGTSSTTGRGLLDSGLDNSNVENNSGRNGSSGNALGSFPDREVDFWNRSGMAASQRTLEAFCKVLAGTMAHEIGHSLGLNHTTANPRAPATRNLMAPSSVIDPAQSYGFDQATWDALQRFMPGVNRRQHAAAWTARWLVQESAAIVVATPKALKDGRLGLDVHAVLAGDVKKGPATVGGFAQGAELDPRELAAVGRSIWCLSAGGERPTFAGAEAEVISLAGRSEAEWAALVREQVRLAALERTDRAAWLRGYAALLERCLGSSDSRIRTGALVELSLERDAAKALAPAAADRVLALAASGEAPADARVAALQALTHRADARLAPAVLSLALSTDEGGVIAAAAGVLEETFGLAGAAERALPAVRGLEGPALARGLTLLGWLKAEQGVALAVAQLRGEHAAVAADALGLIGHASSLAALQAASATDDAGVRARCLRAIGRIGTDEARAWLSALVAQGDEEARYARDFAGSWLLE